MPTTTKFEELLIKGIPISRGIAIGKPYLFSVIAEEAHEYNISPANSEEEIARYRIAMLKTFEDVKRLRDQLELERAYEAAAIIDTQLQIMQDPLITTQVEQEIRKTGKNAEYVFQTIIKQYKKKFSAISDPVFKERFRDLEDLSRRILGYLRDSVRPSLMDVPANSVIFANELTASDTAEAKVNSVNALITAAGGATSHAAIIAKAKGIPYVANVDFEMANAANSDSAIVDGRTGEVILNPKPDTLSKYQKLKQQLQKHVKNLEKTSDRETETRDGYRVALSANIDMVNELDTLKQYPGHGIGLFRSEYIFLSKKDFPTEEEQYGIYKKLAEKMKNLPVVIRTFDVGGDKFILGSSLSQADKPFLERRAIRFLLEVPEIFKTQLRAILRASAFGNVRILFPMVSALSELRDAKKLIKEVQAEFDRLDIPYKKSIDIGCMIEVPSAAIITDLLAKECNFISIGTNDLVQYTLAVDRANHAMSELYNPTHPGVIRLIKLIVDAANQNHIPVTLCGEMASDPRFTPLLLGLGIHEMSVGVRHIPVVKNAIRHTSIVEANRLAEQALALTTGREILDLLTVSYRNNVPDDLFYHY
jgi:phosphotransferase system enzyme I (PtsI)